MTLSIHIQGGTNAGTKRPPQPRRNGWMCDCPGFTIKPGHFLNCPDCGARAPERKAA